MNAFTQSRGVQHRKNNTVLAKLISVYVRMAYPRSTLWIGSLQFFLFFDSSLIFRSIEWVSKRGWQTGFVKGFELGFLRVELSELFFSLRGFFLTMCFWTKAGSALWKQGSLQMPCDFIFSLSLLIRNFARLGPVRLARLFQGTRAKKACFVALWRLILCSGVRTNIAWINFKQSGLTPSVFVAGSDSFQVDEICCPGAFSQGIGRNLSNKRSQNKTN